MRSTLSEEQEARYQALKARAAPKRSTLSEEQEARYQALKAKAAPKHIDEGLSGVPYLIKQLADLSAIPAKVGKAVPKLLLSHNPDQVALGAGIGAVSSVVDAPAAAYNAAMSPFEHYAAYKYGENNVGKPVASDAKSPDPLPYKGHEITTNIVDSTLGKPANESERYGRVSGEILGGLIGPPKALKGANAVEGAIKRGIEKIPTPNGKAIERYTPVDLLEATKNKEAARELGFHVTPAEASGEPYLAAKQGTQGYTKGGAESLHKFQKGRNKQIAGLIDKTLDQVSTGATIKVSPDADVRGAAKSIIAKKHKELQEKSAPFYDAAYKKSIGEKVPDKEVKVVSSILGDNGKPIVTIKLEPSKEIKWPTAIAKDPSITRAIDKVWNAPENHVDLEGFQKNSTKVLDLAKRELDSKIAQALKDGEANKVRVLTASKKRLTNTIDKLNPIYKLARGIYEHGSPAIEALENGTIGKIANRKDTTIKNIGKDIFDHAQTDPKIFREIQHQIYKEDPEVWKNIVRQELGRQIGTTETGATNFYNKILKDNKTYKQFHDALSYNPKAQRVLGLMKQTFGNLIESVSTKSAAEKGANLSLNKTSRVINYLEEKLGGKFDEGAIDLILDPRWDERVSAIGKIQSRNKQALELINVLEDAAKPPKSKG
jgi:hypothetical protein